MAGTTNPTIIVHLASRYTADELCLFIDGAKEAWDSGNMTSRSVGGQSVTFDPRQAESLFETYIEAHRRKLALDAGTEADDIPTAAGRYFNLASRRLT